ncbi:MAG: hypothetical protein H0W64_03655 [Gammaproteobacteria bacterium]|nr:hypothetical protein [Gammaproteobacteria bacterium]
MSLLAIKNHMLHVRIATLASLCTLFNAKPETIRCLLRHFIAKGKIRVCQKTPACGSKCSKCPVADTEMYEWVEPSMPSFS